MVLGEGSLAASDGPERRCYFGKIPLFAIALYRLCYYMGSTHALINKYSINMLVKNWIKVKPLLITKCI